jgi:ATP-dependent DNA helicase RecG
MGSKVGSKVGSKLTLNQEKILLLIIKNPHITKKDFENNLDIGKTAIDNNIFKLKQNGILKRIGPDKGGYWKVIEK